MHFEPSTLTQNINNHTKPKINPISMLYHFVANGMIGKESKKKKKSSSDRSGKPIVQTAAIVKISNISRHLIQEGSSKNLHKISQPDANYLLLKIL